MLLTAHGTATTPNPADVLSNTSTSSVASGFFSTQLLHKAAGPLLNMTYVSAGDLDPGSDVARGQTRFNGTVEAGGALSWVSSDCQSNGSGAWTLTTPVCSTKFSSFVPLVAVTVVLALITLWTILGNVLVLWALYRYRYLRTMSNCLIGNLAVSDLLLAVTVLPISTGNDVLGYWVFGRTMCTVWLSIDVLYCTASIWGLCTIAFDRYTATVYPMWYHDKRSTRKALAYMLFVWLFSIVISLAPFIGWQDMISGFYIYDASIDRHLCILFSTKSYVVYSAVGSFILPSCFMTFLYVQIFVVLHRQADTLKKRSSLAGESPSHLLPNGCPAIAISAHGQEPSCAVTRDFTASTFMAEETFVERGDEDDDEDEKGEKDKEDGGEDERGDKGKKDGEEQGGHAKQEGDEEGLVLKVPLWPGDAARKVGSREAGGTRGRHRPAVNTTQPPDTDNTADPKPSSLFHDIYHQHHNNNDDDDGASDEVTKELLRDQRSNSLQADLQSSELHRQELSRPAQDLLTVSACDIPLQFRLKKSRSTAFNLHGGGSGGREGGSGGAGLSASLPRSKSALALCGGGGQQGSNRQLLNGHGSGSGASALNLHRLSIAWQGKRSNHLTTSMRRRFQLREQRATKRMLLIMACFFVCWVPFTLMYLLRSLCRECSHLDHHVTAFIIWLGYVNSSLNPLLYTLFNDDFRKAFKKLLHIRRRRRRSAARPANSGVR